MPAISKPDVVTVAFASAEMHFEFEVQIITLDISAMTNPVVVTTFDVL